MSIDYTQLTDKELRELRTQKQKEIAQTHNMQLAKKIQLNSAYGALSQLPMNTFVGLILSLLSQLHYLVNSRSNGLSERLTNI